MTHAEIAELLGAYSLDALDDDERALVEEHLASCPRCRAEVEEHHEVASRLAQTGGAAPEGLWERIAGSLEQSPPGLRLAPVPAAPEPAAIRHGPSRRALAAIAAAVLVLAALGLQIRQQNTRIDELEQALADPLVAALQAAIEAPGSQLVELTSGDGNVVLLGAVTDDGVGYLRATALPPLPDDRTYQLWGVAGDDVVSLGVLGATPDIVSFRAGSYEALAVTEEVRTGVVTSRNDPVVAGTLT